MPEDRLIDLLDEAVAARVVVDVPGALDRARFAHLLIRDTLYTGLSGVRRARLHRLAVEALEELYGDDPGPHLAELAHHAIAAGEHGKALRYAEQAATRSLALLAYEEAARLYRMALQALGQRGVDDQHARCELLLGLGEAQIRAGETARAKAAFLEAADVARRIGLPRELARAAAGYGGRYVWARAGDDARLVPLLEEALDGLGDDPDLRARLLARLTGALRDEHARDRRTRLSSDAVALAARGPSEATLAYALDARLAAIAAPDTVHECLALADQLREMAERNSDTERVVAADFHRLIARVTLGAIDGARADLVAMIRGAADLRQPAQLWQAEALQAMFAIATGQLAEANAFAERAWILGRRALERVARPVYVMQRYAIAGFGGDPEPFEALMRELVADYPARPVFRSAVVHVLASAGRACDARRAFDEFAADDFSALPLDLEWLYGMCFLAESCGVLGDRRAAAVLHGKLLPYATYLAADPPEGFHGAVSRYLGILATTTGEWGLAERHFDHALGLNARTGARPLLARTQQDYARMLSSRARPEDELRARQLLDCAFATYRDLRGKSAANASVRAGAQSPL